MNRGNFIKYFNNSKPVGSLSVALSGILLLVLGVGIYFEYSWILAVVGVYFTVMGACMLYVFMEQASFSSVDEYCRNMAAEFFNSKRSNGEGVKVPAADRIFTMGYSFEDIFKNQKTRRGNDGILRSSLFSATAIFFSENNVYCYVKRISLISDETSQTERFFAKSDVAGLFIEEIGKSAAVRITVNGDESITVVCHSKSNAAEVLERIKNKLNAN